MNSIVTLPIGQTPQRVWAVSDADMYRDILDIFASLQILSSRGILQIVVVTDAQFGATGNGVTDDTAAINAAITFAALTGSMVFFPAGIYAISSLITINSNIILFGAGSWKTYILQTNNILGALYFNPNYATGGGIRDISLHAVTTNPGQTKSSGIGLRVNRANGNFFATNIDINGFATGIQSAANFYTFFQNFEVLNASAVAIHSAVKPALGGYFDSAGVFWGQAKLSNFGTSSFNGASVGILIESASGDHYTSLDATVFNQGVVIKPPAGSFTNFLFFDRVLADTSIIAGWTIDGTNGSVFSTSMTDCWAAFTTAGRGVEIVGALVSGFKWVNGNIRENGTDGVLIANGTKIIFSAVDITKNSITVNNTFDGVSITGAGVSCQIVGCAIGNFASTAPNGQRYGVSIGPAFAGTALISSNDLAGNLTAPLINQAVAGSVKAVDNFPIQTNVARASGEVIRGASIGTIAAGSTNYLGPNAQQALEVNNYWVSANPGNVIRLYVAFDIAAGGGQTYTATLNVNGVGSALTGVTAGFLIDVFAPTVVINSGDVIDIVLVTSAGAGVPHARWMIEVSY